MRPKRARSAAASVRRERRMPEWVRRIDLSTNRRINAAGSWHAHDRAYRWMSRRTDRRTLWYAIALLLAVTGHRRAALRGVGSMIVAGVVSDVIVKSFFDGRRPAFAEVPPRRRLHSYPTTPSFPSGHSASAAGFAVGVGLELPAAGAAIGPIAAGVAYSRLHVGAHWLSDVAGGLVIGTAVAALGRLLVPGRARRVKRPG